MYFENIYHRAACTAYNACRIAVGYDKLPEDKEQVIQQALTTLAMQHYDNPHTADKLLETWIAENDVISALQPKQRTKCAEMIALIFASYWDLV